MAARPQDFGGQFKEGGLPIRASRRFLPVELLKPAEDDYFVLRPMHSGFFSTTLDVLLERLQVQRLVLTGFAADICVLYTANDAYMQDFRVAVPSDCVASETKRQYRFALEHMTQRLKADTRPSDKIRFR